MKESNKRWFVLIGILNKVFSNDEVKELYQSGKVKIYGPYDDEKIKSFFESKKLLKENIIQKIGDSKWKPLHSYEDIFIRSLLSKDIFIEKKSDKGEESVNMVINSVNNPSRKIFLGLVFISVLSIITYYYYYDNIIVILKNFTRNLKEMLLSFIQ